MSHKKLGTDKNSGLHVMKGVNDALCFMEEMLLL